jgi:hypothetical protein
MLKRNGQPCQRSVPDYPGRLTDFEFLAYGAVFESVADDFKRLSGLSSTLTELEHVLPRLVDACAGPEKEDPEIIPARDGPYWQAVAFLMKLDRTSLLLCRRETNDQREFSVIEQLDPNSALAKAKGTWQVQMTSNDARLLLQDFIDGERQALQLYAGDIVAVAREVIDRKYPGQKLGRVTKAISQRCQNAISTEQVVPIRHSRKESAGIRV